MLERGWTGSVSDSGRSSSSDMNEGSDPPACRYWLSENIGIKLVGKRAYVDAEESMNMTPDVSLLE